MLLQQNCSDMGLISGWSLELFEWPTTRHIISDDFLNVLPQEI